MARKKRESGGRGPKRRRQKPPLDKLPDRRAMEGVMQQVVAGLRGESDQDTPLAKFVAQHPQDDPAREEMTVPGASGPLKLVLSWVAVAE